MLSFHKLHTACELGDMETMKLGMQCYAGDLAVLDRTEQQVQQKEATS